MSADKVTEAYIEQQAVELSMVIAIEDRGAYSVDEMRGLMGRYEDATEALDAALREDFRSMPPEMQKGMREMLSRAGDAGRQMLEILDAEQR